MDLGRNELTGEIPVELGELAQLEDLDLGRNQLTGKIPGGAGGLDSPPGAAALRQ